MKSAINGARLSVLSMALCGVFSAYGQTQSAPALNEVVVTATRMQTVADEVISDVTVISREEIERSTGRSVTEMIARSGGVQVSSTGGLGKASSLFIRGTESRHVLLLVDGVRYGSATLGTPNFDTIPLEMIDHIEVLKGPASALYGSDAVGGVVQIFTRKGAEGIHPYASLTVGEGDRSEAVAGLNAGTGNLKYSLGVQTLREKGFSATNSRVAFGSFNPDADGFSQSSVNGSLQWNLTPALTVSANVLRTDGTYQFDNGPSTFDSHADFITQISGLGLAWQVSEGWKSSINLGSGEDRSLSYSTATPSRFDTVQDQWTWQNEVDTPVGVVLAGVENLTQRVSGSTAYTVSSRSTDSAFVGLNGSHGPHNWQLNARHDDNSQFGSANTTLAGYAYKFSPDWKVFGSTGTSFKAPTFNALYFPGFGNATTLPESGRNSEVGVGWGGENYHGSLTYFQNRIQGFITTLPVVANIPVVRIEGYSLAVGGERGAFDYHAQLDLLDARNELTGLKLIRRPDQQLTVSANYAIGQWKLGTSLLIASDSYENAANTQSLGGYGTVDAYAAYDLQHGWGIEAKLVNAGDKAYQTASGYNQPGRSAYLTLRYAPK